MPPAGLAAAIAGEIHLEGWGTTVKKLLLLLVHMVARWFDPAPAIMPTAPAVPPPIRQPAGTLPVYFLAPGAEGEQIYPVYRPQGPVTPEYALRQLLAGPNKSERRIPLRTALPAGAKLLHLHRRSEEMIADFSTLGADPGTAAAQVAATLFSFPEISAVRVCAAGKPARAILRAQFLLPVLSTRAAAQDIGSIPRLSTPLAGKVIVLNPGHGLTLRSRGMWVYQRPFFEGLVEDRVNAWFALQACRQLRRLGATVYLTRASSLEPETGVSSAARWEEAAKYYLRDIGLPDWVHQPLPTDFEADIDARPLAANYWHADLLISLHNNIGIGSGTLTLYDTANGFRDESCRLADLLQENVVRAIRRELTSRWRSQGVVGSEARYGENHWAQMPSALVEIGFIDHPWDRRWIGSIEFREVVGKAIATAVCEYFRVPLPPGEGPLPLDSATPVVGARPARPPVILCLGEYKAGDAQRYASLLRAQVEARFGSGTYQVESAAGTTLGELLSRWDTLVARQRPSIVLLALGAAELHGAASGDPQEALTRFQTDLTEAVRRVRALCAAPVLTLIPPGAGAEEAARARYNAVIRRVARKTYAQVTAIHSLDQTTAGNWFSLPSLSAARKRRMMAAARMNPAVLFLEALPTVSGMR